MEALEQASKQLQSYTKNAPAIEAWEIYWSQNSQLRASAKQGKIDLFSKSEDLGLSFRIQRQGRIGFSFTTSMESGAIDAAIRKASELCEVLPSDTHARLPRIGQTTTAKNLSPSSKKAAPEQVVAAALRLETLCRSADARITQIREASVSENWHRSAIANSEGILRTQEDRIYSGMVTAKAEANGQAEFSGDGDFSRNLERLNLEKIGRQAAQYATEILGATSAPNLRGPAVLRFNVVQDLIGFLSSSFSAEEVDKGRSLLAPFQGKKIFSDCLNLDDDGTLTGGIATANFDGEGLPTQKTPLVRQGEICGWLTDAYYATKLGLSSTGNASRGIKSPPSISTTNLVLKEGPHSYQDLLNQLGTGVVITNLMGLHTANPVTGDFSLGATGLWVENGKIIRPLRGFAVAGNIIELLKNTRAVGNDVEKNGSTWTPSLLVDPLSISGA